MTNAVIYHAVPDDMRGDTLYPRNQLAKYYPELAAQYTAAYEGREEVATQYIPALDCAWGDVLFLSPVHPQIVVDTMREHGAPVDFKLRAYEIDIDSLDQSKLTVMLTVALGDDGKRFVPYDASHLAEWQQIPQITRDHYDKMVALGEQPFTYAGIPHFLYKGTLDVTHLRVIETTV